MGEGRGNLSSERFPLPSPNMLHTFNNLIAHGGGGKLRLPGFHDVAGAETVAEHLVHGTFNGGGFGIISKARRSIIAADRIVASGLALPCPAMSGAEPWMGSNRPGLPVPREAEGSIPMEPVMTEASSERMSPKRLPVTMTSNCEGSRTNCMAALST